MFAEIASGIGSLAGGLINADQTRSANRKNIALQREFAQNGIRWKIEDAKAAGIHPMYALGASGYSAAPSVVGDTSLGNAVSDMGQNIHRAISSTRTEEEQQLSKLQLATAQADLDGKIIENQAKAYQLRQLTTPTAFPGSQNFIPGQGDSGLINNQPLSRTKSYPGRPYMEPGTINSLGYYSSKDGGLTPTYSSDSKQRLEDSPNELVHFYQNNILPNFGNRDSAPPDAALPTKNHYWRWSLSRQRWVPSPKGGKTSYDGFYRRDQNRFQNK